jgi:predicted RNase H-like HicB family nuclease
MEAGRATKTMTRYLLILEHGPTSWGAYSPEIPGCIAAAETRGEVETLFQDAVQEHLDWMHRDGDPIPEPQAETDSVIVTLSGHAPRRYLVILQPTLLGNWSATPADVPDLILEFSTRTETLHLLRVALQTHLETLLTNGEPLPEPASEAATVAVRLADALVAA